MENILGLEGLSIAHLKAFYLAANLKKFLKVAQTLNIDPSSVTRYIDALEQQLNCQLLERGGKNGLVLTEKGEAILPFCKEILENFSQINPILSQVEKTLQGPLRIILHSGYSSNFILPLIIEFAELHPSINLNIMSILNYEMTDMNLQEADVFIGPWAGLDSNFIQKSLFSYTLGLFASQSYIQKFGMPETEEDLLTHRLIGSNNHGIGSYTWINWHLNLTNPPITPYALVDNNFTAYLLLKRGLGITSFSLSFLDVKKDKILPVLPHVSGPKPNILFTYSKHFKSSKKINALHDFIQEKIKKILGESQ